MGKKILVIDDDRKLGDLIREYLSGYDFSVRVSLDGTDGRRTLQTWQPDLLVLDIMLPGESGLDILGEIRRTNRVPVIVLTAKGEDEDRIVGLELGADDYLTKPFHPRELLARIKAILRRTHGEPDMRARVIEHAGVRLYPEAFRAEVAGKDPQLSGSEFTVLRALMENAGRVMSRDDLMNQARGREHLAFDRSIDVHISSIRKKLRSCEGFTGEIRTVWGSGYLFAVQNDGHAFDAATSSPASSSGASAQGQDAPPELPSTSLPSVSSQPAGVSAKKKRT